MIVLMLASLLSHTPPAPPKRPAPLVIGVKTLPVERPLPGPTCGEDCLSPVEAVTYADALGPRAGVSGKFRMTVRAVGETPSSFFLNSEEDYRDRNCLTIAIPRAMLPRLLGTKGLKSLEDFRGKRIIVAGVARKVRIDFISNGRRTDKYDYQIHVRLPAPGAIGIDG